MRRRKREENVSEPAPACVCVEYSNLPPESRQRLDTLLREWAAWHVETYPAGYRPPEVLGGVLKYETAGPLASLPPENTLPVVEDRPHPPARLPSQTVYFNVNYEKSEEVPHYNRAIDTLLTRKRSGTHLGKSLEIDSTSDIDAIAESRPHIAKVATSSAITKRFKSTQRCFNCGSYGHTLRECWKEYDNEAVEAARSSMKPSRQNAGQFRYFIVKEDDDLTDIAAQTEDDNDKHKTPLEKEFPEVIPGELSAELRYALGLGPSDPPPWLNTMRALGVPPWYDIEEEQEIGEEITMEEGGVAEGSLSEGNVVPEFIPLPPKHRKINHMSSAHKVVKFPGINAPLPEGADSIVWNEVPPPPLPMTAMKQPERDGYSMYPPPPPPPPPPLPYSPYSPPVYSYAGSYPGANYGTQQQQQQQQHYPPQDWNPSPIPDASYYDQAGNIPGRLPSHDQDSLWYQDQKPPHQYYYSYGH